MDFMFLYEIEQTHFFKLCREGVEGERPWGYITNVQDMAIGCFTAPPVERIYSNKRN
jgi:hypothetical protein